MALENAAGEFLALIDDDECPSDQWLLELLSCIEEYDADAVMGPVIPSYETEPPKWVVSGGLYEHQRFRTGTLLTNARDTRTGNVLMRPRILTQSNGLFDRQFGITGGEDTDFFRRALTGGARIVWCDQAYVTESVPASRLTWSYFAKRAMLRGAINARSNRLLSLGVLKSLVAVPVYIAILPFSAAFGRGFLARTCIKLLDHAGKLLTIVGFDLVKARSW
jgi:succinoglycan biosynthesis protein ExoM